MTLPVSTSGSKAGRGLLNRTSAEATPTLFAADAGGSHTRVLVAGPDGGPHRLELGSINPHATGAEADRTLDELLIGVRDRSKGAPALGWLASASVDPERAAPELARLRGAADRVGLAATVVVSNDVVPLLWGVRALSGVGVVAVCGTGTGFLGADGHGRFARAGGHEYLGSDEGGAVDLGLAGLRAAVRATDGRGPATDLLATLAEAGGMPVTELARSIAAEPFPKQHLANLAPAVCAAWQHGDPVAGALVDRAVGELVTGVRAIRDRLALPDRFAVAAAGGVLTGVPALHRAFAARLRTDLDVTAVELVADTAAAVLTALRGLAGRAALPRGVDGQHAWVVTTPASTISRPSRRDHVAWTVPGRLR